MLGDLVHFFRYKWVLPFQFMLLFSEFFLCFKKKIKLSIALRKRDFFFARKVHSIHYITLWQILKIFSARSYIFTFVAFSYIQYTLTRLCLARKILRALARNFLPRWLLSLILPPEAARRWIKKLDSATVLYSKSTLTGCLA